MAQVTVSQIPIKGIGNIPKQLVRLFHYLNTGQIVVDFGRWVVLFCGRISETAMLLATLWVTATFVTPELTAQLGSTALFLSSLSMIAFSLLPEVILFSAIIKTLHHWRDVLRARKSFEAWAWAVLYSLPTLTFFGMTIYTIASFASTSGHIQTATGFALVTRCLAGWFYSLVGLIHAGMMVRQQEQRQEQRETQQHTSEIERLHQELTTQCQQMEQHITGLTEQHHQTMYRQQNELQTIQQMLVEMQKSNTPTEQQKADCPSCEIVHCHVQSNSPFSAIEVFGWSDVIAYQEWSNTPAQAVVRTPQIACVEAPVEQGQNTDEIPVVSEPNAPRIVQKSNSVKRANKPLQRGSTRKTKRTRGDATEQVREVLETNKKASLTDIVNETGLSRSRVSEIRTAILREWQVKANSLLNSDSHLSEMSDVVSLNV